MAWQNGRIPLTELARLPWEEADHLYLTVAGARSMGRIAWRFELAHGDPLYISDGYRTYDQQVVLKKQKGPFAATPGTSNHGWARACDMASRINVDKSAQHRWMEQNGPAHGWTNPTWASDNNPSNGQFEPWHWEYDEKADQFRNERDDSFPLTNGSAGRRVFLAQRVLGITVDGHAGPQFVGAIQAFQRQRGLTADGIVGPATWAELFTQEDIVVSRAENQADIRQIVQGISDGVVAYIDRRVPKARAYVLPGAAAAYRRVEDHREHVTEAIYAGGDYEVLPLPAASDFWSLPLVGEPGEVFQREGAPEVYTLDGPILQHVSAAEWDRLRTVKAGIAIRVFPADHDLWDRLPKPE